eukprot:TRINITY_DN11046_c0_g1_i1.p1 TRINITY_DN11046_c0_g1~~TRINITY_DN11046_c0_g1_i1.p1  ORF type:complete len:270 (+),score=32.67 TRINITY_DN11046_c0_g1_i1:459-1268(+)
MRELESRIDAAERRAREKEALSKRAAAEELQLDALLFHALDGIAKDPHKRFPAKSAQRPVGRILRSLCGTKGGFREALLQWAHGDTTQLRKVTSAAPPAPKTLPVWSESEYSVRESAASRRGTSPRRADALRSDGDRRSDRGRPDRRPERPAKQSAAAAPPPPRQGRKRPLSSAGEPAKRRADEDGSVKRRSAPPQGRPAERASERRTEDRRVEGRHREAEWVGATEWRQDTRDRGRDRDRQPDGRDARRPATRSWDRPRDRRARGYGR